LNPHEISVPTPPKPLVKDAKDFATREVPEQVKVDDILMILYDEST